MRLRWFVICFFLLGLTWERTVLAAGDEISKSSQLGPVKAQVTLAPTHPRLGDAITLSLEVVGEKGVELVMPEFGQSLGRFAIIDFVPAQKVGEGGKTVASQRYTLQPPMSGEQHIPPLIIGFVDHRPGNRPAPDGEDAYELLTERLTFAVASVIPKGAEADLKPPKASLEPWSPLGGAGGGWWWSLLMVVMVASGGVAFLVWRKRGRTPVPRTPFEVASSRLKYLKSQAKPTPEEMDEFFVQLSDIVRHYLEDRFQIRAPEKTTEEFLEAASSSPDLTAEHRGFLFRFLEFSDQVKFARHRPSLDHVEQALAAAEDFLRQTGQQESSHA
ncbi:MAG: hypothetical protein HQL75_08730 [Magnetococcales bacterium]|nr:hypothetical protein [Magnetococcales bacterium]